MLCTPNSLKCLKYSRCHMLYGLLQFWAEIRINFLTSRAHVSPEKEVRGMSSESVDNRREFFSEPEQCVDFDSLLCPWEHSSGCVYHRRGVEWEQGLGGQPAALAKSRA